MKIHVGSTNTTKIKAVKDATLLYPHLFPQPEIIGVAVAVPLLGHPKNLAQTIDGAKDRAKKAFFGAQFSFGIEGGLMEVPGTKTGFMEVGACAIYDGKDFFIGLSPAFEWPKSVTDMIITGKADASTAFRKLGLTKEKKLGATEGGIISFLTDKRLTRELCTIQAIISALIYLDKPQLQKS